MLPAARLRRLQRVPSLMFAARVAYPAPAKRMSPKHAYACHRQRRRPARQWRCCHARRRADSSRSHRSATPCAPHASQRKSAA